MILLLAARVSTTLMPGAEFKKLIMSSTLKDFNITNDPTNFATNLGRRSRTNARVASLKSFSTSLFFFLYFWAMKALMEVVVEVGGVRMAVERFGDEFCVDERVFWRLGVGVASAS